MKKYGIALSWKLFVGCWCVLAAATGSGQAQERPLAGSAAPGGPASGAGAPARADKTFVGQGISVELGIASLGNGRGSAAGLIERNAAMLQLSIIGTETGVPMKGFRPAVWIDRRRDASVTCKDKISSFLQASLAYRPDLDLSSYYIVTLNDDASVSVIDPVLGLGTTKLVSRIPLQSPGGDWVLSRDGRRLFVAMPLAGRVAVIDTSTWKQLPPVGPLASPVRVALQPDQKYMWVQGSDNGSGGKAALTAIDAQTLKVAASIPFAGGSTGFAFTDDNRYAFAASSSSGVLAVIDVRQLKKHKEIMLGARPAALAYSSLSKALYVATEGGAELIALDGQEHRILARIRVPAGLSAMRFTPDGRWGFLLDRKAGAVHVLDASINRLVHSVDIGAAPSELSFTASFAYVRAEDTEQVTMIGLAGVGKPGTLPVSRFPGGQFAPGKAGLAAAASIVPSPEGGAVLVSSPLDKTVYYYAEGMAAPMGSFQNYGSQPRSVLVLDRSLRETAPGIYSANFEAPVAGTYDVAFLLGNPRIYHCFTATVEPDAKAKTAKGPGVRVQYLTRERTLQAGEVSRVQFRLTDPATGAPRTDAKDVRVLALLAPGVWQRRVSAKAIGEGIYEAEISVPRAGVYYLYVESPSLRVRYNQLPYLIMQGQDLASAGSPR